MISANFIFHVAAALCFLVCFWLLYRLMRQRNLLRAIVGGNSRKILGRADEILIELSAALDVPVTHRGSIPAKTEAVDIRDLYKIILASLCRVEVGPDHLTLFVRHVPEPKDQKIFQQVRLDWICEKLEQNGG